MSALDVEIEVQQQAPQQQQQQQRPEQQRYGGALAAAAHDSDADSLLGDVFDGVSPPPAPAPGHLTLLQQVTAEIAELNARNAHLQQEIDSLSVASSSNPSPQRPPQPPRRPPAAAGGLKPAAGSHSLLPPTPDLSQV